MQEDCSSAYPHYDRERTSATLLWKHREPMQHALFLKE